MPMINDWIVWAAPAAAGALLWGLGVHFFSPEARERRRRSRSHGRVVSSRNGPTVNLAVKTPDSPRSKN